MARTQSPKPAPEPASPQRGARLFGRVPCLGRRADGPDGQIQVQSESTDAIKSYDFARIPLATLLPPLSHEKGTFEGPILRVGMASREQYLRSS